MRPGQIHYRNVRVVTAAGAAVTGLTAGSFTLTCWVNGAGATATVASVTEIGGGDYRLGITTASTAGWHEIVIAAGANVVDPARIVGEIEAQDAASIYAAAVVTRVDLGAFLTAGQETAAELVAKRRAVLVATIRDSVGNLKDLSGYTNWRMTVRKADGTGSTTLTTGITGTSLGVLSVDVPETAAFFADIDAAITAGLDSIERKYDVVGDAGGSATNTECVLRGTMTLYRYETAP